MLLVSIALTLGQFSAVLSGPRNAEVLTVHEGSRTYVAKRGLPEYGSRLGDSVSLNGHKYSWKNSRLVDERNASADISSVAARLEPWMPDTDIAFRCKGGIAVGGSMFWLFSWDAFEIMGEPSYGVIAVEVLRDSDGLKVGRTTLVKGLGEHLGQLQVVREGENLALVGYGISIVSLKSWKETQAFTGGSAGGVGVVGSRSDVYWSSRGHLHRYDFGKAKLVEMSATGDLGELNSVFGVRGKDILVFERGLFSVASRGEYRYPKKDGNIELFVVPDVGVGVVGYTSFPEGKPGVFLKGEALRIAGAIRLSSAAR